MRWSPPGLRKALIKIRHRLNDGFEFALTVAADQLLDGFGTTVGGRVDQCANEVMAMAGTGFCSPCLFPGGGVEGENFLEVGGLRRRPGRRGGRRVVGARGAVEGGKFPLPALSRGFWRFFNVSSRHVT